MKKTMMVSFMLTLAVCMQAQLKVSPTMEKGKVNTYETKTVTSIAGQKDFTLATTTEFTTVEATADGYVVSSKVTGVTSDATADNVAAKLLSAGEEMMKGLDVQLLTDKDGQVKGIKDYDALKQKIDASAAQMIDSMLAAVPQLGQMMPKEVLKSQIMENATEENLVKSYQSTASVLALNGKTVMTGAQEEYTNTQGLKMKRMYFVNGKNVTVNESKNMTKDEMKALIVSQVEKMMPQQADMIKQNIDQVMASGMLDIDSKGTASYEFGADGWANTIKMEVTSSAMGQDTKMNTTVTRVK